MSGTILAEQPLCLHRRIGDAVLNGMKVEVLSTEPTGQPMIVREDGKTFLMSWEDILRIADKAFLLNDLGPEEGTPV